MKAKQIDYSKVSLKTPSPKITRELEILRESILTREKDLDHVDRDCRVVKILCDTFNGVYDTAFANSSYAEKRIIIRALENMFNGRPLTPLENNEDDWAMDEYEDGVYHHKRYPSLWKIPDGDGWRYSDRKRAVGSERDSKYQSQMLVDILDEIDPIQFPYTPANEPYIMRTMSFCLDPESTRPMRKFDFLEVIDYARPRTGYWRWFGIHRYFCWNPEGRRLEITKEDYEKAKKEWLSMVKNALDEEDKNGG